MHIFVYHIKNYNMSWWLYFFSISSYNHEWINLTIKLPKTLSEKLKSPKTVKLFITQKNDCNLKKKKKSENFVLFHDFACSF